MVEVDVFWAYGIGAGFAAAATHQIALSKDRLAGAGWQRFFSSPYVFVGALGSAIVASVLIHLLGWWVGVPVAAVVVWAAVVRPRTGLAYLFYRCLSLVDASTLRGDREIRPTGDLPAVSAN